MSKRRNKGPLREIVALIHPSKNIYEAEWVLLSCGHKVRAWGGIRARCRHCAVDKKTE